MDSQPASKEHGQAGRGADARHTKASIMNVATFHIRHAFDRDTETATSVGRVRGCALLKDRCLAGVGTSAFITSVYDDVFNRDDDSDDSAVHASCLQGARLLRIDVVVGK